MSEAMTRGADVMFLRGNTLRHDRAGVAVSMPLPCGDAGPTPLMIDADRFAGLIDMGITSIDQARNALSISTKTGLRAVLPALADPHRAMELAAPEEHESIAPDLFSEWLDAALALTTAASSTVVCTYRSHAFVFNRRAMAATRLSTGWPMPSVVDAQLLRYLKRHIAEKSVDSVKASKVLLLVQAQARVLRIEVKDAQLPQTPIEMLANAKAHKLPSLGELRSEEVAAAVRQIALTHAANSTAREVDAAIEMKPSVRGLVLRSRLASVEIDGRLPAIPTAKTSLSALKMLQAAPQFSETIQLLAYPGHENASAFIVRAGTTAFFMAATAE